MAEPLPSTLLLRWKAACCSLGGMKCANCPETSETKFAWRDAAHTTRHTFCDACRKAYKREWYQRHRDRIIKENAVHKRKRHLDTWQKIAAYLADHPCVDCGEADPVVLDFDHIEQKSKRGAVSKLRRDSSWEVTLNEIQKCVVRCANCHRRRTAKQFGWAERVTGLVAGHLPSKQI